MLRGLFRRSRHRGLFRRSRQERVQSAQVQYELVPHSTEADEKGPAGEGYVVRRAGDDQFLQWETLHYSDPLKAFPVVGVKRRLDVLQNRTFRPGSPLQLVPEPDNPYDPNAVAVWDFDRKLQVGYVPRERAEEIGDALEAGEKLKRLSMWEVTDAGKRVALRALLIHEGVTVGLVAASAPSTAARSSRRS